jgi:hypothetical protein
MARRSKLLIPKDRAVFVFEKGSQERGMVQHKKSYNYVKKMLNIMMAKSGVEAENIFIGGHKEDLILYMSGIIELYYLDSISIDLAGDEYTIDPDFDVPNKID